MLDRFGVANQAVHAAVQLAECIFMFFPRVVRQQVMYGVHNFDSEALPIADKPHFERQPTLDERKVLDVCHIGPVLSEPEGQSGQINQSLQEFQYLADSLRQIQLAYEVDQTRLRSYAFSGKASSIQVIGDRG